MIEKMRIKFESYKEALEGAERQKDRFDSVSVESELFEGKLLSVVVCKDTK